MRRIVSVLVVVVLAGAVALIWVSQDGESPPDTLAGGTSTTTSDQTTTPTSAAPTTTTPSSTTTPTEVRVVDTVEEAEAILRELWFGWFEGIYDQNEERIREVVVLEETVETALEASGEEFTTRPEREHIAFADTEILRSDQECLVVRTEMRLTEFREGESVSVHVLRFVNGEWRRLSLWRLEEDLWEQDCDSLLSSP